MVCLAGIIKNAMCDFIACVGFLCKLKNTRSQESKSIISAALLHNIYGHMDVSMIYIMYTKKYATMKDMSNGILDKAGMRESSRRIGATSGSVMVVT
jgi:hypothetical protein